MIRSTFLQFFRYNLVGVANTLVGFSIIFLLMYFGIGAKLSNSIGYALGSILSYYLNKKYTFKSSKNTKLQVIKFFAVLLISYLLNFVVLHYLLDFMNPYYAQLIAAVVYTFSSYILMKFFVFKDTSL